MPFREDIIVSLVGGAIMKAGDMVRFKQAHPPFQKWRLGLLVEYEPCQKVATVLHEGEIHRLRAENVQKAGKKDYEDADR